MRKSFAALAIAALMVLAAPAAANAEGYTPDEPDDPTLSGSIAVGECDRDVPYIRFSVTLTDPDAQSTGHTARLILSDATHTHTIELGELVDNHLSGRVLWPGASVGANGAATGWPGWAFVDGKWVETDGNFRWTRGAISAKLEVNPEVPVALSYPPATPVCATDPRDPSLPATGLSAAVLPIGIAGGVVALLGVGLIAVRRRSRTR